MTDKYLLILGIGHVLGDFYFQNEKIARYKTEKYKGVLLHSVEYYIAFLFTILPFFCIDMVLISTYAALAHFVIDSLKYMLLLKKRIKKGYTIFALDQCVHLVCIFVLAYLMNIWNLSVKYIPIVAKISGTFGYDMGVISSWILAILLIHIPANIFIQNFLGEYKPNDNEVLIKADYKAGRRIGTMERLIMLIFLSKDQFTALGFVLTAKSIARYDKITKDEKFAEYYLLGTLISTLWVIICEMFIWG